MSRPDFARALGITEPIFKKLLSGQAIPNGAVWRIFLATGADPYALAVGRAESLKTKSEFKPEDYRQHCSHFAPRNAEESSASLATWIEILLEAASTESTQQASVVHEFLCQQLTEAQRLFGLEDATDVILKSRHKISEHKTTYGQLRRWKKTNQNYVLCQLQLTDKQYDALGAIVENREPVVGTYKRSIPWSPGVEPAPRKTKKP